MEEQGSRRERREAMGLSGTEVSLREDVDELLGVMGLDHAIIAPAATGRHASA